MTDTILLLSILLSLIVISLCISGHCYHLRFQGSDKPNFSSAWKSFINILDLYTDIIFCVYLYLYFTEDYFWGIIVTFFIVLSHLISNIIGIYHTKKWKKIGNLYIIKYNVLMTIMDIFGRFCT